MILMLSNIALAVFIYMNLLFILALTLKKNDIVDVAWGMGFFLVVMMSWLLYPDFSLRRVLVSGLVSLWAFRLSGYIFLRNKGKNEDFRYAQWRKDWGKHWVLRSYLQVFILQGFFLISISYPLLFFVFDIPSFPSLLDLLGLLIWIIGFGFEAIGDAQLMAFKKKKENRGKIMTSGLWKYTRHPNYFGEATMWWGIFFIALNTSLGAWSIFSPIIITVLLMKVSGVPMLEQKYANNPEYQAYVKRTSSFVPRLR